jgi:putative transposase
MDKSSYRAPVTCFVTFCAIQKLCLFGIVEGGAVILTETGRRMEEIWLEIVKSNPGIDISTYVVMPNHFHGLISLVEQDDREKQATASHHEVEHLYDVIRDYKSFSTHAYNRMHNMKGVPLWQRGYYEHIVRDEKEYSLYRRYIENNPARWSHDRFYMDQ